MTLRASRRTLFTIDVDTHRMETRLRGVESRAEHLQPVWLQVREDWVEGNARRFRNEGRIGKGRPWRPLSPAYAKRKKKLYPGAKILVRTGALRSSLTTSLDVNEIRDQSMAIGSRSKVGQYHRHGANRSRGGRLPSRKPVLTSKNFNAKVRARVRAHILASQNPAP